MTFTVTIVGLANVVDGVGLGSDPLRDLAIAVLLVFGVACWRRRWATAWRRRCRGSRASGPQARRGDGFRSGLLVGGALGFVYTPCAGPILAAVISVSAARTHGRARRSPTRPARRPCCWLLSLGGRRVFDRIRKAGRGPCPAARARRDDDRHGGRDHHQPRRQLRPVRRREHPERQPHGVAGVLESGRPAGCTRSPATKPKFVARQRLGRVRSRTRSTVHVGAPATRARPRCWRTRARCPTSARRRNSPKPRTGSTRPGDRPLYARRAARTRGADRLLDLHVHQLHPHAALPEGVGRRLPATTA